MSDHRNSSSALRRALDLYGWAWVPLPLLLLTILALWVADLRTSYESRTLLILVNFIFTWLVSLCVAVVAGRSFLANGQPGLLLFGAGALLWGSATLVAGAFVNYGANITITIHNVGIFGAALCHLGGLTRGGRVHRPGRWLGAGYAGVLVLVTLLVSAARAGSIPVFFVQGQGGTLLRQVVLGSAIGMLATTSWLMLNIHRRQPSKFFYFYALGLALLATGLGGVWLQSVQGSALGWTGRLTQCLGGAYLFLAALAAARQAGPGKLSFAAVEAAWRKGELLPTLQNEPSLWLALRYAFGAAAVAAAFGLHQALTAGVGPGLPTFILFYPAVIVVALLAGLGPGLLATALTLIVVNLWIMPPVGQWSINSPADRLVLALFAFNSLLICALAELYRRHKTKAAAFERELALRETREALRRQAEEAASRSQKTFAELIERSPFGTYIVDSVFRITMMNASSQDGAFRNVRPVTGRPLDEAMRTLWPEPVAAEIIGHFRHTLETGEPYYSRDFVNPRHDVEIVESYEWELHRMTLPDGQHGVICYYYDSTSLRQAEAALRASEERLRLLGDNLPDSAVYQYLHELDGSPRFLHVSAGIERINGVRVEDVLRDARTLHQQIEPEYLDQLVEAEARSKRDLFDFDMEVPMRRPDGEVRWMRLHSRPRRLPDGRTLWDGVQTDITERKRVEEALRLTQASIDGATEMVAWFTPDGRLKYVNDATCRALGYSREELLQMTALDFSPGFTREKYQAHWQELREWKSFVVEPTHRRKDGTEYPAEVLVNYILHGGQEYLFAYGRDITDRKQAEEALRESEEKYRNLFAQEQAANTALREARRAAVNLMKDAVASREQAEQVGAVLQRKEADLREAQRVAHVGSWDWDAKTDVTIGSDELLRIYGFDPATQTMPNFQDQRGRCYPVEDWERLNAAVQRTLATGVGYELDVRAFRNGATIWVTTRSEVRRDGQGEIAGLWGTVHDITARKQAEQALKAELERARLLHEVSTELIQAENVEALYEKVVDTAVAVLHSDFASLQVLHPERGEGGELRLLAYRGFSPQAAKFWEWVSTASESACGVALRTRQQVLVPDVRKCGSMAASEDLATCLETGIAAVQTTPLVSRSGELLGMISTHWREVHEPTEGEIRALGVLARQAADLIERMRAEEGLRRFKALMDHNPSLVFLKDEAGRYVYLNESYRRQFVLSDDWPGKTDFDFWGKESAELFRAHDLEILQLGKTQQFLEDSRDAQGRRYCWLCHKFPFVDAKGGKYLGGIGLDVTDRVRAEEALRESQEHFRSITDTTPVIMWMSDATGAIKFVNQAYREFFGVTLEQVAEAGAWQPLVHPDDVEKYAGAFAEALKNKGPFLAEARVRRVDGQWRWIQSYGAPRFDEKGDFLGMAGSSPDVTDRKEFQAELERLVAERTARLQEMVGELEHFSYTITHDMRAPLRGMRGFGELLLDWCAECEHRERREFIGKIMTSADRMDALIRDALNYSRSVRQELPLENVETGALLRGMLDTYPELQASRAHIRVEGELPVVLGNQAGLTQCFSNLLGNALKFAKPGETPEIRVWAEAVGSNQLSVISDQSAVSSKQARVISHQSTVSSGGAGQASWGAGWVRICVEDKGIGISKEMLPRVFEMFSRGSSSHDGTGIGLALVRKVAQRMGGRAGVESEEGKGSRFWLELQGAERSRMVDHKGERDLH